MPGINRPTYTDLIIFAIVLFSSIASKFSKNHFVVWLFGSDTK